MRFHELLEGVGKYRPMFNMFMVDGQMPHWVDHLIRQTEKLFKREDRVVWALRWARLIQATELRMHVVGHKLGDPSHDPSAPSDLWPRLIKGLPNLSQPSLMFHAEVYQQQTAPNGLFSHFFSLNAPKIDSVIFGSQTPNEIIDHFEKIEDEWKQSRRQIINHKLAYGKQESDEDEDEDEDEDSNYNYTVFHTWSGETRRKNPVYGEPRVLLDFKNGWAWWDLNRAFCSVEGDAMGHCGNAAEPGEDDRVLSLRKHMGGDDYRPSCTFILNKNGYLGEMKGRANEKPKAEYHDMIVSLLMMPMVRGIVGGGYQSNLNFSVLDLPEEVREHIVEQKPTLLSPSESRQIFQQVVKEADPASDTVAKALKSFEGRMRAWLKDYNLSFKSMRMIDNEAYAILSEYSSIEAISTGLTEMLEALFEVDNLARAFRKFDRELTDDEAEALVKEAYAMNFASAAKICLEDLGDNEFELEGVGYKVLDNGRVLLCISSYNLSHPVGRNDPDDFEYDPDRPQFVFDRLHSLDDYIENDHGHGGDAKDVITQLALDPEEFEDYDAVMALITYVVDFTQSSKVAAEQALFDSVRDPERTVFSRDPRQLNLFDRDEADQFFGYSNHPED